MTQRATPSASSLTSRVRTRRNCPRSDNCPFIRLSVQRLTSLWHLLLQAQQENDEAEEVFELMNRQLIEEIPQLLELRVPYFDPSFEAMIRMQCKFAEEGYEKLGGVQR